MQDVRTGALTYGHRFLAMSGRPGRSVKVRSVSDYKQRLGEHFILLEHSERHDRLVRELDAHARRLGGRVASQPALLHEVADLVEYPSVVAGVFPPEFLALPDEVLTTTMIHHQHYFPVLDDQQKLLPAFLAVTNIEVEQPQKIAINAERVLTARLRDARFFWDADRRTPLEAKLARLDTLLFHKALGSYAAKAERLERLARWIVTEAFGGTPAQADDAGTAGRLAKADLTTDMVREFTELQGVMGGIYAREDGSSDGVWKVDLLPVPAGRRRGAAGADRGAAGRRRARVGGGGGRRSRRHAGGPVRCRRAADRHARSVRACAAPRRGS